MLGPFDPLALSAGIATNLAHDILKHRSQSINNTLVGKMLTWAGIREPDFEKRLDDTVNKTLTIFFDEHPDYQLSDIEDFFRDPVVAQQLADYILDRQPIDRAQLQHSFEQHLHKTHSATRLLIQRKGISSQQLIDDFLHGYRQVLREQLSVPQMGILLDVIDQNTTVISEIQASEDRLKQYIEHLLTTKLSPSTLQAAYKDEQQHVIASATAMVQSQQPAQVSQHRTQPAPKLFTDGLCKGRILHPPTNQYFVSHGFDKTTLADWRDVISESLAHINNATQPFQPYFAGDTLLGGFRLCAICERIYSTLFSLFLLPVTQDRNVYLELGIAIGLGRPFLLIQEHDATIPSVLTSLTRYTKGGLFRTMRRELAGQVEEYDFGAVQFVTEAASPVQQPQYVVVAGELIDDEDFEGSITDALASAYPNQLSMLSLSTELTKGAVDLKRLIEMLQTSRFAIFRVDEQCSPATFLALGMSIGLSKPFLMIQKAGKEVPLDLRGLGIYAFANFSELTHDVVTRHRTFFDTYMQ